MLGLTAKRESPPVRDVFALQEERSVSPQSGSHRPPRHIIALHKRSSLRSPTPIRSVRLCSKKCWADATSMKHSVKMASF
jgi:hypothetical protein